MRLVIGIFWLGLLLFPAHGVQPAEGLDHGLLQALEAAEYDPINFREHVATVKRLVNEGANLEARDSTGLTVLMRAACLPDTRGGVDLVEFLLDKGANLEARDSGPFGRGTALVQSTRCVETNEVIRLLLERGANIEAKNDFGETALMHSAFQSWIGGTEPVKLLLKKGAYVDARDNDSETALIKAAESSNIETVKLLLEKGANLDAKDRYGNTVLMAAASNSRSPEIVEFLEQQIGSSRAALEHYMDGLKKSSGYMAPTMLEHIIKLVQAMKPPPAPPEETKRYMARGAAAMKAAKTDSDYWDAVEEFYKAVRAAPWYADAYYNLAMAQRAAKKYGNGVESLRLYLLAAPDALDTQEAKNIMYQMEFERDKAAGK